MTSGNGQSPGRSRLADLGCYILPGQKVDPMRAVPDTEAAEALGLGTAWLSEKWGQKDCSVLLGAMAQATSHIRLGAGVTHPHTRHPMVLANFGATMQAISGGRFVLGLGRGTGRPWADIGLPTPTMARLRDTATIVRRLWAGSTVTYDGPAGRLPAARLENPYDGPAPPLVLAATGPKTLTLGGEVFDGVLTQPFLTTEALARTAELVKTAGVRAGRDRDAVRVVHTLPLAPDLAADRQMAVLGGRLVRYVQAPASSAAMLPELNGWDASVVEAVRSHPILVDNQQRHLPPEIRDDVLATVAAEVVPEGWLQDGAAVGTAERCAARVQEYLDAGADEIILHGVQPTDLATTVEHLA